MNPREVARGARPVLTHVGRRSGAEYRTPMDAHPVEGGYLFVLMYGSRSDWVRNVLAAGRARLRVDGREVDLANPRLVDRAEAHALAPGSVGAAQRVARVHEFLRMDALS